MSNPIRNIAIFAHVDAGKTSITEQLLFASGAIRKAGTVNEGNTQTDTLKIERERGISIFSAHTSFIWRSCSINLVDTPGHVDFSGEVKRIIPAIDGAVLVLSAVESIQAQTLAIWNALRKKNIPTILFINKIDRIGTNPEQILYNIQSELKITPLVFHEIKMAETSEVAIRRLWDKNTINEAIAEIIASNDEKIMSAFFEGKIDFSVFNRSLADQVSEGHIFPLLFGSAKYSVGISDLADAIVDFMPSPQGNISDNFVAIVFGISHDKNGGRLSHLRIKQGRIAVRDNIRFGNKDEKVLSIRRLKHGKPEEINEAGPGELIAVSGLSSTHVGDIIGTAVLPNTRSILQEPLIIIQVKPANKKDYIRLAEALSQLNEENPSLSFEWLKEESEFHLHVMGNMQIEVLQQLILERFGIECLFENPTVIYKETPEKEGEGFVCYWMPKPCWAILKFRIEPGTRGSGIKYKSLVNVNDIARKYQNEVERTIVSSLKQGIKGWEVTDIRITLIEGEDHEMHSRPGDFIVATPMGIMDGLTNCGTRLLEPMLKFRIRAEESLLGSIISDIIQMRGRFDNPEINDGSITITGVLPLATSFDYAITLSSRSGGKAFFQTEFEEYQPCEDKDGIIRTYKGISPLDTAKWILKARGAIT